MVKVDKDLLGREFCVAEEASKMRQLNLLKEQHELNAEEKKRKKELEEWRRRLDKDRREGQGELF